MFADRETGVTYAYPLLLWYEHYGTRYHNVPINFLRQQMNRTIYIIDIQSKTSYKKTNPNFTSDRWLIYWVHLPILDAVDGDSQCLWRVVHSRDQRKKSLSYGDAVSYRCNRSFTFSMSEIMIGFIFPLPLKVRL